MPISRGEVWLVNLDPTSGAEIQKTRPVIMISSDAVGALPLKLVAPLTEWKVQLVRNVWQGKVVPAPVNGLTKPSAVDTLQLRGIDTRRFVQKLELSRLSLHSQPVRAAGRADVCLMEAL